MDELPSLTTPRLRLVIPTPALAAAHVGFIVRNRANFSPWEPPRPFDLEDETAWARRLAQSVDAFHAGLEVRFALLAGASVDGAEAVNGGAALRDATPRLIGRANFTQIERGPFQSCRLGYQIDAEYEGRGLMREALAVAIDWLFSERRLHRIEANHRPENVRSGVLLARLGFERTGVARRYLFIDGAWRDHVQTQKLNEAFDPAWLAPG